MFSVRSVHCYSHNSLSLFFIATSSRARGKRGNRTKSLAIRSTKAFSEITTKPMLEQWAKAIEKHEGFYLPGTKSPNYPSGSRSYRNNNPGNLRFTKYTASLGANDGYDNKNFIRYKSYAIGFNALKQFLKDAATDQLMAYKGEMTLLEFYSVYAPSTDGNYPKGYATAVATDLKVGIDTKIKTLLDAQPVPTPQPAPTGKFLVMSQRDEQWKNVTIGNTNVTLGNKGCTITCVAMSSSWFGELKTPKQLAKELKFTDQALLIWSSIGNLFKNFQFEWRFYTYDQTRIDEALKNPGKTLLLNVDKGAHWVHALNRVPFMKTFWVADPWDGKKKFYSGVVGGAILVKK